MSSSPRGSYTKEVAGDAGVQQFLERLGAGTLDQVPLELGDDARGGRVGAGIGRIHPPVPGD